LCCALTLCGNLNIAVSCFLLALVFFSSGIGPF